MHDIAETRCFQVATGRRFMQRYEIYGTKRAITYDHDEITRLNVFDLQDATGEQGFRAIDVGPEIKGLPRFLPLANFGPDHNEVKAIEASSSRRRLQFCRTRTRTGLT